MALTVGTAISIRGPQGTPGISFLVGDGAPTGTASEGQGYIDDVAGDLYKFTGGSWAKQRSIVGPMGLNGINGQLLHGQNPPDANTFDNKSDALYLQYSGEVWYFDYEGTATWTDSGQNLTGPTGASGTAGQRGTQIFHGNGPFNAANYPNAAVGDMYFQDDAGTYAFITTA